MMIRRKHHMIPILFPVILFVIFALSASTVVLLAAQTYTHIIASAGEGYTIRTALRYVREKVRQNDRDGCVETGTFDGLPALILHEHIDDNAYSTYLYSYDGALYELYAKDGTEAAPQAGTKVLDMARFDADLSADGQLITIRCTDDQGRTATADIAVRSAD